LELWKILAAAPEIVLVKDEGRVIGIRLWRKEVVFEG
jgi:hypothetical protein